MILGAKWPHELCPSNAFNFIKKYVFNQKVTAALLPLAVQSDAKFEKISFKKITKNLQKL